MTSRPHQYFRNRIHGFIFFGNDADVKDSREDENEAWSRRGTCKETERKGWLGTEHTALHRQEDET